MVSIITPHYERSALLREMIASVVAQTYAEWELIVIDDQSSEDVWRSIQTLAVEPRVRMVRRTSGLKGPNSCRNQGLEMARGDYVVFLDSDDLLAPWCLGQRVEILRNRPELDFAVFPVLLFHSEPGDRDLLWNRLDEKPDDLERFLGSTPPWCMTSPIWRTESLRQIGGLAPNLRYGTDSELHTRALVLGLRHEKFPDRLPDVFVRRDDTPRFNSELSDALLDAHVDRVLEGTRLLLASGTPRHLALWERQYFAELEFLLFNAPQPRRFVERLLQSWSQLPASGASRFLLPMLRGYANLTIFARERFYLAVRIARRLLLGLLPKHLHPDPASDGFHRATLPPDRIAELRQLLAAFTAGSLR